LDFPNETLTTLLFSFLSALQRFQVAAEQRESIPHPHNNTKKKERRRAVGFHVNSVVCAQQLGIYFCSSFISKKAQEALLLFFSFLFLIVGVFSEEGARWHFFVVLPPSSSWPTGKKKKKVKRS
jgi:hypothetical protein